MCVCPCVVDISEYGIHSPVRVAELRRVLQGYSHADYILNGFSNGFPLGIKNDYELSKRPPKRRPSTLPLINKLSEEVKKGRIIGPFSKKPLPQLFISPLYVIPKPHSDKCRMIFNLSYPESGSVNDNIPESCRSVKYCSVQDVGQCILANYGKTAWLAKVDLADAYRIVPIQKSDWKFLGMYIEDQYYVDRMLPMGASSACQLFTKISDSLRWIFQQRFSLRADVFNYLDDFLFVSDSQVNCEKALGTFEDLCDSLGVPIASHKTVRPAQSMVFLGIGIDAALLSMFIPNEKKVLMFDKLTKFLAKSAPKVKMWQSIAGSLNHVAQVLVCGRIYLSSIYQSLAGILSQQRHKRRAISREVKDDLKVWFDLIANGPVRPFKMFDSSLSTCLPIYTDSASSIGFGGICGTSWFYGVWPKSGSCNIAVLELYPIYVALSMSMPRFSDTAINIFTDNLALVSVINRLYCRDQSLRVLMRAIVQLCLRNNIHLVARHISGEDNIGPDLLSRGQVEKFRHSFPHMDSEPTSLPDYLMPQNNNLIQWKRKC